MPVIAGHGNPSGIFNTPGIPQFNPMMLLHGEETLEIFKPILPGMKVVCQEKLADFADKKKGAAAVMEKTIKNQENGEVLSKILTTIYIRGLGGFGHKQTVGVKFPKIP